MYPKGSPSYIQGSIAQFSGSSDIVMVHPAGKVGLTGTGGLAVRLTNATNLSTLKGCAVTSASGSNFAFQLPAVDYDVIGFVYESGIAANKEAWIVVSGIAEVLIDGAASSEDFLRHVGNGRLTSSAGPTGLGALNADVHFKECGHCLQTVTSGAAQLVKALIHFN